MIGTIVTTVAADLTDTGVTCFAAVVVLFFYPAGNILSHRTMVALDI